MTGYYDWNPMPHVVSIACPNCKGHAEFEFAEAVAIENKGDVAFFLKSKHFEYVFQNKDNYVAHHRAFFFHGLPSSTLETISDLPKGYGPEDWAHSPYLYRTHGHDIGTLTCTSCSERKKHQLQWPQQAYFQIDYRNHVLWAFNEESLCDLIDFIRSDDRDTTKYRWSAFLRHVPSQFLGRKARESVVKKLEKLLV